jgi:uncharacterized protein YndB with AHSA1/START domain
MSETMFQHMHALQESADPHPFLESELIRHPAQTMASGPRTIAPSRPRWFGPICATGEMDMTAPPELVWAWLIRAGQWPTWLFHVTNLAVLHGHGPDLELGTRFRFRDRNVGIRADVHQFIPGRRLAMTARSTGMVSHRAWTLEPSVRGCRVMVEDRSVGFVAHARALLSPTQTSDLQLLWLCSLANRARRGPPL